MRQKGTFLTANRRIIKEERVNKKFESFKNKKEINVLSFNYTKRRGFNNE